MVNDDHKSIKQKIALGLATKEELLKQIKVELNMLDSCQLKIDVRLTNDLILVTYYYYYYYYY